MRFLNKPEYIYRPSQLIRRLLFDPKGPVEREVVLPWKCKIRVRCNDAIGHSICTYGVYDLVLTEAILRLLDRGEMALDIGTNIGYAACVMAFRTGAEGRIVCFEASSAVFADLTRNVESWSCEERLGKIEAHHCGVSSHTGTAQLNVPSEFRMNRGVATLQDDRRDVLGSSEEVRIVDLDSWLRSDVKVGLMKIDVEGHELAVLEGASALLSSGRVRDIIFEEHAKYRSRAQALLESAGYQLFRLSRMLRGPLLLAPDDPREWYEHPIGVVPNFLATRNPARAKELFAGRGWLALRQD